MAAHLLQSQSFDLADPIIQPTGLSRSKVTLAAAAHARMEIVLSLFTLKLHLSVQNL